MRSVPLSFRALVALTLALLTANLVDATRDYQLILNFQNATARAESTAAWWAGYWFTALDDVWFNCNFLEPGEKPVRRLEGSSDEWDEEESISGLRGHKVDRNLQTTSCPSTCSSSGSTRCRSLGCAFCGVCRRRTRHLQVSNATTNLTTTNETRITPTAALSVERWFNSYLKTFCYSNRGCLIYAKIYRILRNGTSFPLTGNTIAM